MANASKYIVSVYDSEGRLVATVAFSNPTDLDAMLARYKGTAFKLVVDARA